MADTDVKAWLNGAQQLFDGPQDISEETPTTTGGLSDGSMAFFVGKPKTDGSGEWTLKKVTPENLNKMVFNYLTQSNIASLLASVLGGASTTELITSGLSDYDNLHGGWYFCGAGYSAEDRPEKSSGFVLNKKQGVSSGFQVYFPMNSRAVYIRTHSGEAWSVWVKYTGVPI